MHWENLTYYSIIFSRLQNDFNPKTSGSGKPDYHMIIDHSLLSLENLLFLLLVFVLHIYLETFMSTRNIISIQFPFLTQYLQGIDVLFLLPQL